VGRAGTDEVIIMNPAPCPSATTDPPESSPDWLCQTADTVYRADAGTVTVIPVIAVVHAAASARKDRAPSLRGANGRSGRQEPVRVSCLAVLAHIRRRAP